MNAFKHLYYCQCLCILKVCHFSSQISQKTKRKSAIRVEEDTGEDCISHHGNKGDDGQDPSL